VKEKKKKGAGKWVGLGVWVRVFFKKKKKKKNILYLFGWAGQVVSQPKT
jgi:hypothetical protein